MNLIFCPDYVAFIVTWLQERLYLFQRRKVADISAYFADMEIIKLKRSSLVFSTSKTLFYTEENTHIQD